MRQLPLPVAITRGRLLNMNPLKMNGGIFVRREIMNLSLFDDRKKQVLAIIDNFEGGFDKENMNDLAEIARISDIQANNAFMALAGLGFLKANDEGKWVLNEQASWLEASK